MVILRTDETTWAPREWWDKRHQRRKWEKATLLPRKNELVTIQVTAVLPDKKGDPSIITGCLIGRGSEVNAASMYVCAITAPLPFLDLIQEGDTFANELVTDRVKRRRRKAT